MNIKADKISFSYNSFSQQADNQVLDEISFELTAGESVALIGPSGSGKSTLARLLNGLLKPDAGSLIINGRKFSHSASELRELRRKVGLVFQFPESQIFAETVYDEIAFAAKRFGLPRTELPNLVAAALHSVGLDSAKYNQLDPLKLSGGESRLISIASLNIVDPEWLILDEPTLGLDLAHRTCVAELIELRRQNSRGVFLISHDVDLIYQVCPRTIILQQGKICYDGNTFNLFASDELCAQYNLTQPEIVILWKSLHEAIGENLTINELPYNDVTTAFTQWIEEKSPAQKEVVSSVLKRLCSGIMT